MDGGTAKISLIVQDLVSRRIGGLVLLFFFLLLDCTWLGVFIGRCLTCLYNSRSTLFFLKKKKYTADVLPIGKILNIRSCFVFVFDLLYVVVDRSTCYELAFIEDMLIATEVHLETMDLRIATGEVDMKRRSNLPSGMAIIHSLKRFFFSNHSRFIIFLKSFVPVVGFFFLFGFFVGTTHARLLSWTMFSSRYSLEWTTIGRKIWSSDQGLPYTWYSKGCLCVRSCVRVWRQLYHWYFLFRVLCPTFFLSLSPPISKSMDGPLRWNSHLDA